MIPLRVCLVTDIKMEHAAQLLYPSTMSVGKTGWNVVFEILYGNGEVYARY